MPSKALLPLVMAAVTLAGCNKSQPTPESPATTHETTLTMTAPPPGGSWADVVNETDGGYLRGNPDAKVKLVEIASLLCPFCKRFTDEAATPLVEKYVKTGQVSWEFRPYLIHGPADMAANLIAECNGPKSFFPLAEAMYKDQEQFEQKLQSIPAARVSELQDLPSGKIFGAFADEMGMAKWAAARGIPSAQSAKCLADQQAIEREVARTAGVTSEFPDFKGTPTFIIDGEMQKDVGTWAALEPLLQAKLK